MFGLFLFEFGQKFILANNPPSLLYMAGWLGCSLIEAAWSERRKERAGQMTREGERGVLPVLVGRLDGGVKQLCSGLDKSLALVALVATDSL